MTERETPGAMLVAVFDRDVVRVSGSDAESFLQGQVSQDVQRLEVGESAWSLILAPQGKVDAWFRVSRLRDGFLLDLDEGYAATLTARLTRFLLRVDAEIEILEGWRMLSLRRCAPASDDPGDDGTGIERGVDDRGLRSPETLVNALGADAEVRDEVEWRGFEGVDLIGTALTAPGGLEMSAASEFEVARIRAGWPAMGRELTERTIPAEIAGLVESSVSFTKGCYTGQELVARIDSRGANVPRPLRLLEIQTERAIDAGSQIVLAGRSVGRITSAAFDEAAGVTVALGTVHRSVEPSSTAEVSGHQATVWPTPPATS